MAWTKPRTPTEPVHRSAVGAADDGRDLSAEMDVAMARLREASAGYDRALKAYLWALAFYVIVMLVAIAIWTKLI